MLEVLEGTGVKSVAIEYCTERRLPRGRTSFSPSSAYTSGKVIEAAAALVATVRRTKPLAHQITNNVVKTQSANVTLALGASPIMAEGAVEQAELAHARGGLLVNFGTLGDLPGMLEAGAHANLRGKPV
ncbi:HK-domain-containing protein, partial [Auriscalpium vulgare]